MNNMQDIIDEKNNAIKEFSKIQSEKSYYLGEYKERIIAALKKEQIMEDDVYVEIFKAMEEKEASFLKMSRDMDIHKLKAYIQHAEKIGLKYQLVDGLSYIGDIGLVVVATDALLNPPEDPIVRDMDQDFIDAGLGEFFSKSRGKRICGEHLSMLRKRLPEYEKDYKKIGLWDRFIGNKCPICEFNKKTGGSKK